MIGFMCQSRSTSKLSTSANSLTASFLENKVTQVHLTRINKKNKKNMKPNARKYRSMKNILEIM